MRRIALLICLSLVVVACSDDAGTSSAIAAADETAARSRVRDMCDRFLTNPVIEDADISVSTAS